MSQVTLTEAQLRLPELIANLQPGEVVHIFSDGRPIARLISEPHQSRQPRQPGSAIGTLTILAEDDDFLETFSDYMP
jgi:antitoxin (DNA-binding transcriptional repressor) of toxin-antitoxin stability system